jgi:hypothetical protein
MQWIGKNNSNRGLLAGKLIAILNVNMLIEYAGENEARIISGDQGAGKSMIKRVCYAAIGILCFVIFLAVLAIIPPLFLPPGFEFGSMDAAAVVAAGISYLCTPSIYRRLKIRKRQN